MYEPFAVWNTRWVNYQECGFLSRLNIPTVNPGIGSLALSQIVPMIAHPLCRAFLIALKREQWPRSVSETLLHELGTFVYEVAYGMRQVAFENLLQLIGRVRQVHPDNLKRMYCPLVFRDTLIEAVIIAQHVILDSRPRFSEFFYATPLLKFGCRKCQCRFTDWGPPIGSIVVDGCSEVSDRSVGFLLMQQENYVKLPPVTVRCRKCSKFSAVPRKYLLYPKPEIFTVHFENALFGGDPVSLHARLTLQGTTYEALAVIRNACRHEEVLHKVYFRCCAGWAVCGTNMHARLVNEWDVFTRAALDGYWLTQVLYMKSRGK